MLKAIVLNCAQAGVTYPLGSNSIKVNFVAIRANANNTGLIHIQLRDLTTNEWVTTYSLAAEQMWDKWVEKPNTLWDQVHAGEIGLQATVAGEGVVCEVEYSGNK